MAEGVSPKFLGNPEHLDILRGELAAGRGPGEDILRKNFYATSRFPCARGDTTGQSLPGRSRGDQSWRAVNSSSARDLRMAPRLHDAGTSAQRACCRGVTVHRGAKT
jgi:hypothetical protein